MIIVSQNKALIVNFDNVNFIDVDIEDDEFVVEINYGNSDWENIGWYKTEERAKEVLQEIVGKYRQWNKDSNDAVTIIPKVYEMPKE